MYNKISRRGRRERKEEEEVILGRAKKKKSECYVHHRRLPDLGDVGMCGFFYKLQHLMTEGCK
jgi:hypothetical protein